MAATKLAIDLQGAPAVQRFLADAAARVRNMRPLLDAIGATLADNARLTFRDQADPWGRTWAPLSPVTVARRRGSGAKALLDTGRLRNSITHKADADTVTVGTNVRYAPTHQFGARKGQYRARPPIPWGNVPARAFLPIRGRQVDLPLEWRREVVGTMAAYILRRGT